MTESELLDELGNLSPSLRARLESAGFDAQQFVLRAAPLFARSGAETDDRRRDRNRVKGLVEPPGEGDIAILPGAGSRESERLSMIGRETLRRGALAFCVLAGGMATRMGGVVKALVDVLGGGGTFLDARLHENATWSARAGTPVPLWLMTSDATSAPIQAALDRSGAPPDVATFNQDLSLRLTPEGRLFRDEEGQPSTYSPGHGDLPAALRRSGLLDAFVKRGGQYVWIANLDNLGATIDELLLGHFVDCGRDLQVEVTPKAAGDRGGIPVWISAEVEGQVVRRLQVLEEFRLPLGFDASAVRVFNTNTFLVRADALLRPSTPSQWFEVQKDVGGRPALQFERLLQELTGAMEAIYVRVPREGLTSRFLPAKDFDELARRRDEIRCVARARGML
jgi:UTP--glucose-1-phosphate uridylyltransferase